MVGSSHEALHRIFQKEPGLLTKALQRAAMNVDLTEIEPVERRVDTLLRAETDEGTYLLVVESQGQPDDRKRGSWPYYLSYLYEKYRCEPVLIVTTQSRATAKWAAQPIQLGRARRQVSHGAVWEVGGYSLPRMVAAWTEGGLRCVPSEWRKSFCSSTR